MLVLIDAVDGDLGLLLLMDCVVLMVVSFEYRTGMPAPDAGGNGADVLQRIAVPHSSRGQKRTANLSWFMLLLLYRATYWSVLLLPCFVSILLYLAALSWLLLSFAPTLCFGFCCFCSALLCSSFLQLLLSSLLIL